MDKISFAFFGSTEFSKKLLLFLIDNKYIPKSIFSSPPEYSISYSGKKIKNFNYENLNKIAKEYHLSFYEVDSVDGKRTKDFESILKFYFIIQKFLKLKTDKKNKISLEF